MKHNQTYNLFNKNNSLVKKSKIILKKKIIKNLFLHQLKLQLLDRYLFLILKQERKNSYANILTITGQVIYEKHTGCLYKTSLRKSSYALEHLLKVTTNFLMQLGLKKKQLYIIIKGNYTKRGLKKKLFSCLQMGLTFNKIIIKPLIAHNGVRLRRKRRK